MGPKYHLPKIDPIFYGIPRLGTRIGNTNRVMEGSVRLQNIGQNLGMTKIEAIFYLALQTLRRRRGDVKDLHVVVILAVRRAHRVRHGDRNRPVFGHFEDVHGIVPKAVREIQSESNRAIIRRLVVPLWILCWV